MATSQTRIGSRNPVDQYSSMRQIEHETSAILSERGGTNQGDRSGISRKVSRLNTTHASTRTKEYPQRMNGVINLCENDRMQTSAEFKQVVEKQRQIYDLLISGIEQPSVSRNADNYSRYGAYSSNEKSSSRKVSKDLDDLIGEDFTYEDIEALRGLSKDELVRRLIEALRLYRKEKSKRMWIQNELRRILGANILPEDIQDASVNFGAQTRTLLGNQSGSRIPLRSPSDKELGLLYEDNSHVGSPRNQNSRKPNSNLKNKSYENNYSKVLNQDSYTPSNRNKRPIEDSQKRASFNPEHSDYEVRTSKNYENIQSNGRRPGNNQDYEQRDLVNSSQHLDKQMIRNSEREMPDGGNRRMGKMRRLNTISGDGPGIMDLWEQGQAIRKNTLALLKMKSDGQKQKTEEYKRSTKITYN